MKEVITPMPSCSSAIRRYKYPIERGFVSDKGKKEGVGEWKKGNVEQTKR